jgi:hypothetical protein
VLYHSGEVRHATVFKLKALSPSTFANVHQRPKIRGLTSSIVRLLLSVVVWVGVVVGVVS